MFRRCNGCGTPGLCQLDGTCIRDHIHRQAIRRERRRLIITTLAIIIMVVALLFFLSSRRAEASHGPTGYVIHDCCRSVNPASGTSYRTVALAFSPPVRPVFERGAEPVTYLLQWPQLETTTEQLIRISRQRLAVLLAVDASGSTVKAAARHSLRSQQTKRAVGMAFLFGGLMLLIVLLPAKSDPANKKLV